jgi:hypothetical protein
MHFQVGTVRIPLGDCSSLSTTVSVARRSKIARPAVKAVITLPDIMMTAVIALPDVIIVPDVAAVTDSDRYVTR